MDFQVNYEERKEKRREARLNEPPEEREPYGRGGGGRDYGGHRGGREDYGGRRDRSRSRDRGAR